MIKTTIQMISTMTLFVFLSGCNAIAPVQAEMNLQPSTPDISAPEPEASYQHELRFEVRSGVRAQVILSEARIAVKVNNRPAVNVHRVNFPLLREWGVHYLKINDYDRDGLNDIAVMTSAVRGGKNRCYAVYRYNPRTGQFRERKSFDRCNI